MADGLIRFSTDSGDSIVVQVEENAPGFRRASRADGVVAEATATFDSALRTVSRAAESALSTFRDGALKPDGVEIEFGISLNAEVGAVIAKTAVEGHLTVKLSWASKEQAPER